MPYEHFKYTQTEENLNAYPEQMNAQWYEARKLPTGKTINPHRVSCPKEKLPSGFDGYHPVFRRSELPALINLLPDAVKREIRENAKTREDFHDQDKIHAFHQGYATPICLCELRIITGSLCIKHLVKGPDGNTINTPGNMHWAWYIDTAPRGWTCPKTWERNLATLGLGPGQPLKGCDILIENEPPSEEWVLAQVPGDPVGTPAGRAVTDIVIPNGMCVACLGGEVDPETHEWIRDQSDYYKYYPNLPIPRPLMEYRPQALQGKPRKIHAMLYVGMPVHEVDLARFPGVTRSDIWVPWARNNKGDYLDHYMASLAAEEAGEDEDDGDA